ncbi:autotransporter outer membrane beta-barrel domain-containing protein [Granulosicoccaceae sp. 1_MG-2023]|nr:autotransporter outer membrane beta-barrel domain-containing protein [Granulosicoccaceae sp. 1_MG-2023]
MAGSIVSGAGLAAVEPVNNLGSIGASDLQIRTGNAVQAVCVQFNKNGADGDLQADLFDKCGEMVHTANSLNGIDGPVAKDLGISREQLQAALQNVAGEETVATGSLATEASGSQTANVSKRLSALLSRNGSFRLSAVNLFGSYALYRPDTAEARGGAGGDEDTLMASRWGVFVHGDIGTGEKDASAAEDGFSYDTRGMTLGADYRFGNGMVAGLAAGLSSTSSDFDETDTVSGGDMDADVASFSLYALAYAGPVFFDGIVTLGQGRFDLTRSIVIASESDQAENDGADREARSDTDSTQTAVSLGVGSEYNFGAVSLAPYLRAQYLDVEVDGFTETGAQGLNLRVSDQSIESVTSSLGVRLSRVSNTGFGVLVPQARLEWVHEYSDDVREVETVYANDPRENVLLTVTDEPDRDYFSLGLGASAVLRNGIQMFADVRTLMGLRDFSETQMTLGARFEL